MEGFYSRKRLNKAIYNARNPWLFSNPVHFSII